MTVPIAQIGPDRARRPGVQAVALFALFAGAGLCGRSLGAPVWLTVVYVGVGAGAALVRVAWPRSHGHAGPARGASGPAPPDRITAARPPARRGAIGYIQIPEAGDRLALSAHHSTISAYAEEHGLAIRVVVHDLERPGGRPALRWALDRIADGDAQVIVAARLAHLAASAAELSTLLHWFSAGRRGLVAIDVGVDTTTEAGSVAAAALEGVGGWVDRRPPPAPAPPPPRPPHGRAAVADRSDLQQRILALREQGLSLQAIADRLNAEGVPTVRGGTLWRPSSVQCATGYRRPPRARRGIEVPRQPAPSAGAPER